MRVCVRGLWHVGAVTAAGLADAADVEWVVSRSRSSAAFEVADRFFIEVGAPAALAETEQFLLQSGRA